MSTDVWLAMPSANYRKASINLPKWKQQGYKIAILQDRIRFDIACVDEIVRPWETYRGYYRSANYLADAVIPKDCPLIVFAGDDMEPDPNHTAGELLQQFREHFPDLFGIMQPTGDPMGVDKSGLCAAERICGSPFIGRGWIERGYSGMGPWWRMYHHFFGDEELKNVAERLGVLWQRKDLTHFHHHHSRYGESCALHGAIQPYWEQDEALFRRRQSENFPGHQPLAAGVTT